MNNIDSSPLKQPGNQFPGKVVSVVMGRRRFPGSAGSYLEFGESESPSCKLAAPSRLNRAGLWVLAPNVGPHQSELQILSLKAF